MNDYLKEVLTLLVFGAMIVSVARGLDNRHEQKLIARNAKRLL